MRLSIRGGISSESNPPEHASDPPDDAPAEVGFLRTVGLAVTYHCQAACAHCIVEASPRRSERISVENARAWLGEIARYRGGVVQAIALTGGEPFSDLGHLEAITRVVDSHGLAATAVTNAYWATTAAEAERVLARFPEIRVLSFSTDVFHLGVVPLVRVENAVRAARTLGRRYIVAVCTRGPGDEETRELVERISEFAGADAVSVARVFPVGRAAKTLRGRLQVELTDTPPPFACTMAHSPVILPEGRVVACFGPVVALRHDHPLVLGDARTTPIADLLERAERNAILHGIRLWGPAELVRRLRMTAEAPRLPLAYVADSACALCHALLSDPALASALDRLGGDPAFRREVAFGRLHYLGESEMAGALSEPSG